MAVNPVGPAGGFPVGPTGTQSGKGDFGTLLQNAIDGLNGLQVSADNQLQQYAQGNGNLASLVTATAKANLGLEVAVQVRNDLVQAYQTLMNMQV